jgi:hypothetical protein
MKCVACITLLATGMMIVSCTGPDTSLAEGEGEGEGEGEIGEGEGEGEAPLMDSTEELSQDTYPCERLDAWPYSITSALRPMTVHYRAAADEPEAQRTITLLEQAWQREVDETGFRAPLLDEDADGTFGCGTDANIDVFLWRGLEYAFVDATIEVENIPYAAVGTFMVLDPWSEFVGGVFYDETVFHEFHHACQGADDWYDNVAIYEASATFAEEYFFDDVDVYLESVYDAQLLPEVSLDHNDNYETNFMYGQCLYLLYLHEAEFNFDIAWWPRMWLDLRSAFEEDPDYQDALNGMLAEQGRSFLDSIEGYARWRFYTGLDDDGAHLSEGGSMESVARAGLADLITNTSDDVEVSPMVLGMAYVDVASEADFRVSIDRAPQGTRIAAWALPQDEVVTPGTTLRPINNRRTIAVVLLPDDDSYDPDSRTDDTFALGVRIERAQ